MKKSQSVRCWLSASVIITLLPGSTPLARAAPRECNDALVEGQRLEQASKLLAARERFLACSVESCGKNLPKDCRERYEALLPRIPTVVLEAGRGDEQLVEVQVSIDGVVVVSRLDGRALEVDPGEHTFVFTAKGESVSEKRLVLESKKGQSVKAAFPVAKVEAKPPVVAVPTAIPEPTKPVAPAPPPPATSSAPTAEAPPKVIDDGASGARGSTQRWVGLVTGGVGLATMGVGGLVGLSARSKASSADCANGACATPADAELRHSAVSQAGTATLLVGIGAALVAGGVVVWLTAPSDTAKGATRGVTSVGLGPSGIVVGGSF